MSKKRVSSLILPPSSLLPSAVARSTPPLSTMITALTKPKGELAVLFRFSLLCASLLLITSDANATQYAASRDWNNLASGQTTHGIFYAGDGKLLIGGTVL